MKIVLAVNRVFNWKEHPGGVLYLAIPLAVIGLGCLGLEAILHAVDGDFGYLIILACFSPLFYMTARFIMKASRLMRTTIE